MNSDLELVVIQLGFDVAKFFFHPVKTPFVFVFTWSADIPSNS